MCETKSGFEKGFKLAPRRIHFSSVLRKINIEAIRWVSLCEAEEDGAMQEALLNNEEDRQSSFTDKQAT